MEFKKQLIELNNIISKIMYDYETHRGIPIDSIEKYQPDIKKIISQSIEDERKRVEELLLKMPTGLNCKIRIGETETACKELNCTMNDIYLHNSHSEGYDEGYEESTNNYIKWRDNLLDEINKGEK